MTRRVRRKYMSWEWTVAMVVAIVAVAVMLSVKASAQNDAEFTQYWAMPTYYNPAATGSIDYVRIRGAAKLQWVGIKNAPRTFAAMADMPFKLGKKHRLGVGVVFNQERIGLYDNLNVAAQVSYKFRFLKGTWSVGIQPGYYNTKFRGSDVYIPEGDDFHQPDDPDLPKTDVSGNAFDLSAGVTYNHKYFDVGVSMLHITQPKIGMETDNESSTDSQSFETTVPRQLYFTASGNIPVRNSLFSLQPSVMARTDFNDFSAAFTMRATYNRFITFGIGYRWKDAVSAMIGAEFKNFFIGYAYDYPLSAISKASSGSHEIVAGYMLKLNFGEKNRNKHRSIRIM